MRVKTVQVAIQDPAYADCIRNLLLEDGRHQVHIVEMPEVSLAGVIILDSEYLSKLPAPAKEQKRLVVVAHKEHDDLSKIWDAGVRHVVFYGDAPQYVRVVVLGMELALGANGVIAN